MFKSLNIYNLHNIKIASSYFIHDSMTQSILVDKSLNNYIGISVFVKNIQSFVLV